MYSTPYKSRINYEYDGDWTNSNPQFSYDNMRTLARDLSNRRLEQQTRDSGDRFDRDRTSEGFKASVPFSFNSSMSSETGVDFGLGEKVMPTSSYGTEKTAPQTEIGQKVQLAKAKFMAANKSNLAIKK